MLRETLETALMEAEQRIAQIRRRLAELEPLRNECLNLERWRAETLLLMEEHNLRRDITSTDSDLQRVAIPDSMTVKLLPDDDRLWKAIQLVLGIAKKPMSAGEVTTGLKEVGFDVKGEHKRETVRGAMLRKKDIFERVSRGMFALVAWPEMVKGTVRTDLPDEEFMEDLLVPGDEISELTN
jgi:hypothetical protein